MSRHPLYGIFLAMAGALFLTPDAMFMRLSEMDGFKSFHLLRGPHNEDEGYTLFASHTVWASQDDFLAWTRSQQFRDAHKNAGSNKPLYLGHPQFEGFSVVEGA